MARKRIRNPCRLCGDKSLPNRRFCEKCIGYFSDGVFVCVSCGQKSDDFAKFQEHNIKLPMCLRCYEKEKDGLTVYTIKPMRPEN